MSRTGKAEIAAGLAVVSRALTTNSSVDCLLLTLSDAELQILADLEREAAGIYSQVRAFDVLREAGVGVAQSARGVGVHYAQDASRLRSIAALPRSVLKRCEDLRLGLNHCRWLVGLSERDCLERLQSTPTPGGRRKDGVAVTTLRRLARTQAPPASVSRNSPAPPQDVLLSAPSESERITQWLGSPSDVRWGSSGGELTITFSSVEELAGALEKLGVGQCAAPPRGSRRQMVIRLDTFDELAYLTGTAD